MDADTDFLAKHLKAITEEQIANQEPVTMSDLTTTTDPVKRARELLSNAMLGLHGK